MSDLPFPPSDARAWKFGAYALATLVHVPLILVVQQFGSAIAAARPAESVITLLDTPETERVGAVAPDAGRADAVTLGASTSTAALASVAPLGGAPAAISIAPTEAASAAAIRGEDAQSIAGIIASDTLSPASAPPVSATSSVGAVEAETPAPSAVPTIANPVATIAPATVASTPATVAVVTPQTSVVPSDIPAASSPRIASTATATTTVSSPSAAIAAPATAAAPVTDAASRTASAAPAPAQPLPRITIAATNASPGLRDATLAPVSGASSGGNRPTAVPAARVVSSVAGTVPVAGAGGAVSSSTVARSPVVDPSAQTLRDATPVAPARTIEPAPRVAAISPDAAGLGPDRLALNDFVRGYEGGGCFAALTIATAGDDLAVSGFSQDETALAGFEDALRQRTELRPIAAARRVSDAQCSVLAFARAQPSYPDFPVRLTVAPDRIPSGGTISGRLTGIGDRPVTMLILDDEGRIQDATFLLARQDDGDWTFETPLSLTGNPVPTVQLFVALAGDGPLAVMRPPVPVEARRYFVEIDRLLKAKGQGLDVTLAAFTVDGSADAGAP